MCCTNHTLHYILHHVVHYMLYNHTIYYMIHNMVHCMTYTTRFILQSDLVCQAEGEVKRRISGVLIGGVDWKVGKHCLYQDGAGGVSRFGTVSNMYHGLTDVLDDFVIFELENKPITSYMGHYCLLPTSPDGYTTVFVLWDQVTWQCQLLSLGDLTMMALPFKSCFSEELVELT
jgi:hypothetical protein